MYVFSPAAESRSARHLLFCYLLFLIYCISIFYVSRKPDHVYINNTYFNILLIYVLIN